MPSSVSSITGRSSSITNAFVASMIPVVYLTDEEILEALEILRMDPRRPACAYCSDPYTERDHLRPLVVQHRPTGYVSESADLVLACGNCNQSKGNNP
jgi:5-methylcytosine-specific restriction endonuclease McrA